MNNIYLIYGNENYLIKKELSKIIENSNMPQENIIKYNLDEVNVSNIIDEASMVGLFADEKLIICENSNFLTSETKKKYRSQYRCFRKIYRKTL